MLCLLRLISEEDERGGYNVDTFEVLYQKYKQDVYHYLLYLCKNPVLAEDLMSETFLKAYVSLHQLKKEDQIKPWLLTIARNKFLSDCRKKKITVSYEDYMDCFTKEPIPYDMSMIKELVKQKDERIQQLFQMRLDGYSYAEIASTLHISENSCRVIDFRLKKWLKEELKKEDAL